MFEWTVRGGDILQAVVLIVAVAGAYFSLKSDVRVLRHDFGNLKTAVDLMSTVISNMGTVNQQIQTLRERVEELRHGVGFVGVYTPKLRDPED